MTLDDAIAKWLADARDAATVAERTRTRRLAAQAAEDATLAGILVDLAELGEPVAIKSVGGRVHSGVISGVGRDFAVLRGGGPLTIVALDGVVSVRPAPGTRPHPAGDRAPPATTSLTALLATMAADRPRVAVTVEDGEVIAGELRSVGVDVVLLVGGGDQLVTVYVATASLVAVSVFDPV